MTVTRADVEHAAALAHLDLTPDELARMQTDLSQILGYVAQLQQLDLAGVEPLAQIAPIAADAPAAEAAPDPAARLRADTVREGFSQAQALANAPQSAAGCFQVPRVLGATPEEAAAAEDAEAGA